MYLRKKEREEDERTYFFLEAALRTFMEHATKEKIDIREDKNQGTDKHIYSNMKQSHAQLSKL